MFEFTKLSVADVCNQTTNKLRLIMEREQTVVAIAQEQIAELQAKKDASETEAKKAEKAIKKFEDFFGI